jgi:DNA-binding transcriptional MerR regulator
MARNDKRRARPPEPIDAAQLVMRLTLSAGKAAEFCGISRRQLCYWTDKGLIQAVGDETPEEKPASRRVYDFAALYRTILIKREIEQGNSLHRAVQEVNHQLRAQSEREREMAHAPAEKREQFLVAQADRMLQIAAGFRDVVQGHPGGDRLRRLARAVAGLRPAALADDAALVDDPGGCVRLAAALDDVENALRQVDRSPTD